jgi:hypothetical protein
MEQLVFANNGVISLIDILTIGGSEKRNDPTKIGQYSSGLSYAVSILIRYGVEFCITSGDFQYTFQAEEMVDEHTGKSKEVVGLNVRNLTTGITEHYQTAFSTEFGFDWSLAMGIREVYSNCIDENGEVFFEGESAFEGYDTYFSINICDQVQEVIEDWNLYFIPRDREPLYKGGNGVKLYVNELPDQPYTIYKNGIQVYTDSSRKSLFVYDHPQADLDERRVIRELSNTEWRLTDAIKGMDECDIIHYTFNELCGDEDLYENELLGGGHFSRQWHETVNGLFLELEDFPKPSDNHFWNSILRDTNFKLSSKKISTTDNWWSTESVTISAPTEEERLEVVVNEEPVSFEQYIINQIEDNYNFKVEFPIVESIISKSTMKVIAYKNENVLYVATDFDLHRDMPDFIKEHYRLSGEDIYQNFCNIITK